MSKIKERQKAVTKLKSAWKGHKARQGSMRKALHKQSTLSECG